MEPSILTSLMRSFTFTFSAGGDALVPSAIYLLGLIMAIELALIGLWWTYGDGHNVVAVIAKCIGAVILAVLIKEWHSLTHMIIEGFIGFGLKAGGDVLTVTDITNPGNIAAHGFSVTAVVFERIMGYSGVGAIQHLPELLLATPIAIFIVLAYFALALAIFLALLEFYVHAAITTILLPFALNPRIAVLAEKAIAAILASAVRVLVLSFIVSATLPVLINQGSFSYGWKVLLLQLLGAMAVCLLAWRADKMSQALLHGAPNLAIADVVHFARTSVTSLRTVGTAMHAMRAPTTQRAHPAYHRVSCLVLITGMAMALMNCAAPATSTSAPPAGVMVASQCEMTTTTRTLTFSDTPDALYTRAVRAMQKHRSMPGVTDSVARSWRFAADRNNVIIQGRVVQHDDQSDIHITATPNMGACLVETATTLDHFLADL